MPTLCGSKYKRRKLWRSLTTRRDYDVRRTILQEQELRSKGRMLAMVYVACLPLSAVYIYIYIYIISGLLGFREVDSSSTV